MSRKLSQEAWLEKAEKVHGKYYSYDRAVYTGADDPIIITCQTHGDFITAASTLLSGKGCPQCGRIRCGEKKTQKAKSEFIEKASIRHNNKYTYDLDTYVDSRHPIKITCPLHGDFLQDVSSHLKGCGCFQCGRDSVANKLRKNQEVFISECISKHGDKYDYSETEYVSGSRKIVVRCKEHGYFKTHALGHRQGKNCPLCAKSGYKTNQDGYLYIFNFENIIKIGITNNKPIKRCAEVSRSSGMSFEVYKAWHFADGNIPNDIETLMLRRLRSRAKMVEKLYSGSTESFEDESAEFVKNEIEELIIEHTDAQQQQ